MMTIKNYKSEKRIITDGMIVYQHLADITLDAKNDIRAFVVYKIIKGPAQNQNFIEEKLDHKLSDKIWDTTRLSRIDDDGLWNLLFEKAVREGLFT